MQTPNCTKAFKTDGKARREHEASHISDDRKAKESDNVYNYKIALLEYGLLVKHFVDAISNGDWEKVFSNWKFALLYLKADGRRSSKYALECMYLICQGTICCQNKLLTDWCGIDLTKISMGWEATSLWT